MHLAVLTEYQLMTDCQTEIKRQGIVQQEVKLVDIYMSASYQLAICTLAA